MKKFLPYKTLLMFLSVLFGVFYYFLIQVSVADLKHSSGKASTFSFILKSPINQKAKLHIGTERYKLHSVECNDVKVVFHGEKNQWFEGVGEQVSFSLQKGENHCKVHTHNFNRSYIPGIKQKVTFFDYAILFLLVGIPLFHLLFTVFIWGLDQIKSKTGTASPYIHSHNDTQHKLPRLLLMILLAGAAIRILYFLKFGIMTFQHDWHGHIEFIKYIANNWTLPLASKGLEYPQQPLYYLLTGGLYALLTKVGLGDREALYALGYFSLVCSMVFLYYSYRFMTLVTQSVWVRTVAMIFASLTPSLVYLSARINNDSLVMALSAFSLYAIVKSYQTSFKEFFYRVLTGVSLLFMTKISAAPVELLLFGLLILAYYQVEPQVENDEGNELKKKLYWFSVVGVFLLGFTLLRVYLPVENTFHMVNSSGSYPNQAIEAFDLAYFGTFHIISLFNAGYSHVFGEDAIRYSFLTYQYGTMFFGEFDYTYFVQKSEGIKEVMQTILLFGLVYVFGFVSYILRLYRAPVLHKFLFAMLFLNFLLILKFMVSFPAICNTDFRYFVGSFVLLAFVFAQGLSYISQIKWMRRVISVSLGVLAGGEILFFALLFVL